MKINVGASGLEEMARRLRDVESLYAPSANSLRAHGEPPESLRYADGSAFEVPIKRDPRNGLNFVVVLEVPDVDGPE